MLVSRGRPVFVAEQPRDVEQARAVCDRQARRRRTLVVKAKVSRQTSPLEQSLEASPGNRVALRGAHARRKYEVVSFQAEPASSCCPRMRVRCWRRMSTTPAVARATVAAQWLKCRARDGQQYCAVPSSIADRYHLTARQASTCPDLERRARGPNGIEAVQLVQVPFGQSCMLSGPGQRRTNTLPEDRARRV